MRTHDLSGRIGVIDSAGLFTYQYDDTGLLLDVIDAQDPTNSWTYQQGPQGQPFKGDKRLIPLCFWIYA